MHKTTKYTLTAALIVVIIVSIAFAAYQYGASQHPSIADTPNTLAASNPNADDAASSPASALNTRMDPPFPHQYVAFFYTTSYIVLYPNSTSQSQPEVELELISQNSTTTPPGICTINFMKDTTTLPADTGQIIGGTYVFTTSRQFGDLQSILDLLQNKNVTVGFGMPVVGPKYPQFGVTIIAKST